MCMARRVHEKNGLNCAKWLFDLSSFEFHKSNNLFLDEWMTGNFTSFSTAFHSYQDDGRVIMNGSVERNPVYFSESACIPTPIFSSRLSIPYGIGRV